jgi:hypothetical protein
MSDSDSEFSEPIHGKPIEFDLVYGEPHIVIPPINGKPATITISYEDNKVIIKSNAFSSDVFSSDLSPKFNYVSEWKLSSSDMKKEDYMDETGNLKTGYRFIKK